MKTKTLLILFTTVFLLSCTSKKKLEQKSAEAAINEFVNANTFSLGSYKAFNASSIASIEPISQFSETEATTVVRFHYRDDWTKEDLTLKFIFNKTIEDAWILNSVIPVAGIGSDRLAKRIRKWKTTYVAVQ